MRDKFLRWRYYTYNIEQSKRIKLKLKIHTDGHPMVNPMNENLVVNSITSYRDKNDKLYLIVSDLRDYKSLNQSFIQKNLNLKIDVIYIQDGIITGDTICTDIYYNK